MMHLRFSKFLAVALILAPILDAQRALVWRRYGRKLDIPPMKKVTVDNVEDCFGMCDSENNCKAINVNHISMVCELLAVDRCDTGLELKVDRGSSYFDLVADGKCRK